MVHCDRRLGFLNFNDNDFGKNMERLDFLGLLFSDKKVEKFISVWQLLINFIF